MRRFRQASMLLVAACLISGIYGALHNQISYSVSPDYFHAFKFVQFQLPFFVRDRIGASIVGFLASWWMGVVVAVPILFFAGNVPPERRVRVCLQAFGIAVATAFVVGLGALAFAMLTIDESHVFPDGWFPMRNIDKAAFVRAGMMHNFSYLGGLLGIVTGCAYARWKRS